MAIPALRDSSVGMIRVGDVLAVKIRRKCTAKQWQVPFDTVDVLIQAGTLVHDAVSIAPVQAVSTVLVSVLRTIQVRVSSQYQQLDPTRLDDATKQERL